MTHKKKYNEADYEDAHSHIMAMFDEAKIEEAFTKDDVEGLAVILHDLREKFDDPLDVWESNAVSDYMSNLEASYKNKMEKGGRSGGGNMDYEKDILPAVKSATEKAWKLVAKKYGLYEEKANEIAHKSGEGFVAFTDGGYQISAWNPLTEFSEESGRYKMPTAKSQKVIDNLLEECYNLAKEQGLEDEELYEEYQDCTDGISVDFEIRTIYYKPDNSWGHGIKGKHSIRVFGMINADSPEEKRDTIEEEFSFDSISELKEKLPSAINKILIWFKVEPIMEKGGKAGKEYTMSIEFDAKDKNAVIKKVENILEVSTEDESMFNVEKDRLDIFGLTHKEEAFLFQELEKDSRVKNIGSQGMMAKGGKVKGKRPDDDWGTDIIRNLIDRNLIKEEEAGDAFFDETIDSLSGTAEDRFHAIRNLYEQDFIRDPEGDHMEEIKNYLEENESKYEKSKRQFEKGGKAGKEISDIIKNYKPVAKKHDGDSKDGYSVLIEDKNSNFKAWVDVYIKDDDVIPEWNQYIFRLTDVKDVRQKALQENNDIWESATSTAIAYLEDKNLIHQGEGGKWSYKKSSGGSMAGGGEIEYIITDNKGKRYLTNEKFYDKEEAEIALRDMIAGAKDRDAEGVYDKLFVKKKSSVGSMAGGGEAVVDKKTLKAGDTVQIIGRRWFQKTYGNTYHSVEVYVNNELIGRVDFDYGYGNQYQQTAKEILEKYYNMPKGVDKYTPVWRLEDYGIKVLDSVTDVTRRKDLEKGGVTSGNNFWSNYANDGALITGGGYTPHVEKKGFGGFLLGLGIGAVGGYVYRDSITKAKEKAKWQTMYAIEKLEKGGSATEMTDYTMEQVERAWKEIEKSGMNKEQSKNVLAYMGSIEEIQKMGVGRLEKELMRIPTISEKSAAKVIEYFKHGKGKEWKR